MTRNLWPQQHDDGSVTVALRLVVPAQTRNQLDRVLQDWLRLATEDRGVDLNASLRTLPYVVERGNGAVDVVFEGLPGSKLWRDWLVWFSTHVQNSLADVRRVGFWDLVADRPNPASVRGA